ncbi:hypothetical protein [Tychonema sp. LEGE 07203]|uniref:hypothetical protein n=1 Tax=Tychonema sp. LEGE 07203 TaxID=1828671 RepID=UPI0018803696|nr:hypothetical protein [Tychonema sp. LEGE 07203]MBE9093066.1 hypothetical protein [Tychonema sp. LEGE 07203]
MATLNSKKPRATVTNYLRSHIRPQKVYDNRYDRRNNRLKLERVPIVVMGKAPLCS